MYLSVCLSACISDRFVYVSVCTLFVRHTGNQFVLCCTMEVCAFTTEHLSLLTAHTHRDS